LEPEETVNKALKRLKPVKQERQLKKKNVRRSQVEAKPTTTLAAKGDGEQFTGLVDLVSELQALGYADVH